MAYEIRKCKKCAAEFEVRAERHRVHCEACKVAAKAARRHREVERVVARYREAMIEAKRAGYAARRAGEAEAEREAIAAVIHYRAAIERAEKEIM